jgi:hypothetical protein
VIAGLLAASGAVAMGWRRGGGWVTMLSVATLGWALTVPAVRTAHRFAMPAPEPTRPFVQVNLDRTVCDVALPKNGFIAGRQDGFGIFERWILRLGYFTARRSGRDVFQEADLAVFIYPHKPVSPEFEEATSAFVNSGGKVLVIDSPENRGHAETQRALPTEKETDTLAKRKTGEPNSTTNDLLSRWGLKIVARRSLRGPLVSSCGWPSVFADAAYEVTGPADFVPFAWIDGEAVGGTLPVGHRGGSITVVSFGGRFCDAHMGVTGDVLPDDELRKVYQWEFELLREIIAGRLTRRERKAKLGGMSFPSRTDQQCVLRNLHAMRESW